MMQETVGSKNDGPLAIEDEGGDVNSKNTKELSLQPSYFKRKGVGSRKETISLVVEKDIVIEETPTFLETSLIGRLSRVIVNQDLLST